MRVKSQDSESRVVKCGLSRVVGHMVSFLKIVKHLAYGGRGQKSVECQGSKNATY